MTADIDIQKMDAPCLREGKRLPPAKRRFAENVLSFSELMKIRIREAVATSKCLWWAVYLVATLAENAGRKNFAAKLFASGQRSATNSKLRSHFGAAAAERLETIINTGGKYWGAAGVQENRLHVLKPYIGPEEKGVIHVMFSDVISALPGQIALDTLNSYFRLVLEPSWAGICDPGILQYTRAKCTNIVMAPDVPDYEFIQRISNRLVPVSLGSCDWVDPEVATPYLASEKHFDIVMNAIWAPWKRHHVLFSAMRRMRHKPRVALIGVEWGGGNIDRIASLARYYGVEDSITVFERIPYKTVMDVVCRSKCCILLSLKEGANRALPESMFCDVPVLLLAEYIGGGQKNVTPETGLVVPESDLAESLDKLVSGSLVFTPRKWAQENISCVVSTKILNQHLREVAGHDGEVWTRDIAVRTNSPESRYLSKSDEANLAESNAAVAEFVRGARSTPVSTQDVARM